MPPVLNHPSESYNAAQESVITRGLAHMWDWAAQPLAEHVFSPLEEYNRTIGLIALNGTLTAPRLLKPVIGNSYSRHVENGQSWRAVGDVLGGAILDVSDGLDGAAARASGLQSKFGTGFDPWVDSRSQKDDRERVIEQAKLAEDDFVLKLMGISSKVKLANIALGGVAASLSEFIVERKGIELQPQEKAHAGPLGKANFAASSTGTKAHMIAYAFPEGSMTRKVWRGIGIGFTVAEIGFGIGASIEYSKATWNRLRKLKQH